jgi:hypothetical protein
MKSKLTAARHFETKLLPTKRPGSVVPDPGLSWRFSDGCWIGPYREFVADDEIGLTALHAVSKPRVYRRRETQRVRPPLSFQSAAEPSSRR